MANNNNKINCSLKFATWNCQGSKSKLDFLKVQISKHNLDIIFLQETWLQDFESNYITDLLDDYDGISISAMNSKVPLRGRPYGGTAIMWKKQLSPDITCVSNKDHRLCSVQLTIEHTVYTLINCYLPTADFPELQSEYFSKIAYLFASSSHAQVLCVGDFNCDQQKHKSFKELVNITEQEGLTFSDIQRLPPSTYTYICEARDARSWIDHLLVTDNLHSSIANIEVHPLTPSDHLMMTFDMKTVDYIHEIPKTTQSKSMNWKKADSAAFEKYRTATEVELAKLMKTMGTPTNVDQMYKNLVTCLKSADQLCANHKTSRRRRKKNVIGWNEMVKISHNNYKAAYQRWRALPTSSDAQLELQKSKAKFKSSLRKCIRNKKTLEADKLANDCYSKNFNQFWKNVNSVIKSKKSCLSSKIQDVSGEQNIAELWKSHYATLFNSTRSINHLIESHSDFDDFSIGEVIQVCKELKKNKAKGPDDIAAENILFAHDSIYGVLTHFMNAMVRTSTLPSEMLKVAVVPILKKKGLDGTIIKNYRPIALATILSKVLERLLLSRLSDHLKTTDNQFGYKKSIGCEMAILSLKQIISFYQENETPVYVTYLDATQAFDKLNQELLIIMMQKKKFPKFFINLIISWFDNQRFHVTWGSSTSQDFPVLQGVRQGGVLSAYLYAVYMDDLSKDLSATNIGARIGGLTTNHIMYADDICLITTTVSAMKKLLSMCNLYATNHNLEFNSAKTELQCFTPKFLHEEKKQIYIKFNESVIQHNDNVKYLGYTMSCKVQFRSVILDDEPEMRKRVCDIYQRANMIRSYFNLCSEEVKSKLFQTYLSTIYCCSTWNRDINKRHFVHVAHNNALRIVFNLPRRCSASGNFVQRRLNNLLVVLRCSAFSVQQRLSESENMIVRAIYNYSFLGDTKCKLFYVWNKLLYRTVD